MHSQEPHCLTWSMLKADGKLCSDFTTECSLVKAEASFLSLGSCVGMYSVIFLRSSSLAWRGHSYLRAWRHCLVTATGGPTCAEMEELEEGSRFKDCFSVNHYSSCSAELAPLGTGINKLYFNLFCGFERHLFVSTSAEEHQVVLKSCFLWVLIFFPLF